MVALAEMQRRTSGELDPERWAEVCDILAPALALPAAERVSYLDRTCGHNPELRAEVESLIEASDTTAWLDKPAMPYTPKGVLEAGQTIGQYLVLGELGSGGMGVVYKAKDQRLDRLVALKVLSAESREGREEQRFLREARAASALNHPNIVTIYEFNRVDGTNFIAMEYIAGSTLQQLLADGPVPLEKGLDWTKQAAGALAQAHAAGIVHRDFKPGNIMVTAEGSVKVLDFGLASRSATVARDLSVTVTSLTGPGATIGTPAYMSPEQVRGEAADHRSDIFSFGIVLYEIACGRRPFTGPDARVVLYQIEHHDPTPADQVIPSMPKRLSTLIEGCLRKDRSDRMQTMSAVRDELSCVLDSLGAPVTPTRRDWTRRSIAFGSAVSVLGLAASLWNRDGREDTSLVDTRTIKYSLEVQKAQNGVFVGDPYRAATSDTFRSGERFRLLFEPADRGFLYLISDETAGGRSLWLLHPRGDRSALVTTAAKYTDWYVFDEQAGTERLWVVWTDKPLEPLDSAAHTTADGQVADSAVAQRVRTLLKALPMSSPERQTDGRYHIQLHAAGGVIATLLELRHE